MSQSNTCHAATSTVGSVIVRHKLELFDQLSGFDSLIQRFFLNKSVHTEIVEVHQVGSLFDSNAYIFLIGPPGISNFLLNNDVPDQASGINVCGAEVISDPLVIDIFNAVYNRTSSYRKGLLVREGMRGDQARFEIEGECEIWVNFQVFSWYKKVSLCDIAGRKRWGYLM